MGRSVFLALLLLGAAVLGAGALWAQAVGTWPTATPSMFLAVPVASCGSKSYTAGAVNQVTQSTGGLLCTH